MDGFLFRKYDVISWARWDGGHITKEFIGVVSFIITLWRG